MRSQNYIKYKHINEDRLKDLEKIQKYYNTEGGGLDIEKSCVICIGCIAFY